MALTRAQLAHLLHHRAESFRSRRHLSRCINVNVVGMRAFRRFQISVADRTKPCRSSLASGTAANWWCQICGSFPRNRAPIYFLHTFTATFDTLDAWWLVCEWYNNQILNMAWAVGSRRHWSWWKTAWLRFSGYVWGLRIHLTWRTWHMPWRHSKWRSRASLRLRASSRTWNFWVFLTRLARSFRLLWWLARFILINTWSFFCALRFRPLIRCYPLNRSIPELENWFRRLASGFVTLLRSCWILSLFLLNRFRWLCNFCAAFRSCAKEKIFSRLFSFLAKQN